MNFIEACRKLIAMESTPAIGNAEAARFVGQVCEEAGLFVEYQSENIHGLEQINVIARPQKVTPEEEVLFQTHLDTADPGNYALWTKTSSNPFNASIYNDEIYGLGVAEVKLDFLCKIRAAQQLRGKKMNTPFVLVGTFGSETGMDGAIKLIRRKKIRAQKALIGEPTGLQIVHGGPGYVVVEAEIPFSPEEKEYHLQHDLMESSSTQSKIFVGKSAHASHPALGDNAIIKMLEYLDNLPQGIAVMDLDGGVSPNTVPSSAVLEIDMVDTFKTTVIQKLSHIMQSLKLVELEFKKYSDGAFSPEFSTLNVGLIRTYEDYIRVAGSCRLLPVVPETIFMGWLDRLREASHEVGATFRILDHKQAFSVSPKSKFLLGCREILKNMDLSDEVTTTPACTEASILGRLGIECIVFGPGQGPGNAHAPNEKVSLKHLDQATDFYLKVMERFCL